MYLVISQFTFHSRFVTGEDELEDQMALQNFYAGFFLGTFLAFWLPTFICWTLYVVSKKS